LISPSSASSGVLCPGVIFDADAAVPLAEGSAAADALTEADGDAGPELAVALPAAGAEVLEAAELQAATARVMVMVAATAAARPIAKPVLRDLAGQRIWRARSRYVPIFLSPFPGSLNEALLAMRRCRAEFVPCTFRPG
jgi:hypothetical protein